MHRSHWIPLLVATAVAVPRSVLAIDEKPSEARPKDAAPIELTERAREIHRSALLIDGHNDLPWQMRKKADLSFEKLDISRPQPDLNTDIPRLRAGGVGAQFWSAYVDADAMDTGDAAHRTLEQIDVIHRMVERYPDVFEMASTADDVVRIHNDGKIACMIGVEGGHSIEGSLAILRMYYKLGVRYMTLTHSRTLPWADSATDEPKSGGLSPFGEQVVREMNRLGMLVDISHVSAETMKDALRVSQAPIIASHSSAYAVAPHARNVHDDVLRLLADNGGVVMVNFYSGFIVPEGARLMAGLFEVGRRLKKEFPDPKEFEIAMTQWRRQHDYPRGSVHTLLDHIDHIVKVAGVDHVGLGSDFDGVSKLPAQLEDVSRYPYITQGLLDRGYVAKDIRKILGGNALRVLREAEAVANQTGAEHGK